MATRERPPFAALLRRYRLAAGLTQEALAERAHLSAVTVGALERGVNHTPRRDTLDLLAEALGLSPQDRIAGLLKTWASRWCLSSRMGNP
jgi:transcriptional regulator with XRE-family HTH domain